MSDKRPEAMFIHNYKSFRKENILEIAKDFGFSRRDVLESHLWVYELDAQIQKYAKGHSVLKGGACSQIYLPLNVQRCTVDIDAYTDLTPKELDDIMLSIRYKFNMGKFYCSFKEYVPPFIQESNRLPMRTFLFFLPFAFKKGKKKEPPWLKVDFLFFDTNALHSNIVSKGETLGLKLNYSPLCISSYAMICDKLLTFAVNSIGLDIYKVDSFYKNIYDVFYLVNDHTDIESFKKIASEFKHSIDIEFTIKGIRPIEADELLDDVLHTLFKIFTLDLTKDYKRPHKKLIKFEESVLQANVKEKLDSDTWAMMSMYLYLFSSSLRHYLNFGSLEKLKFVEEIIKTYEYYDSLPLDHKNAYIKKLKSEIILMDPKLSLGIIKEPLRLMYLHYILHNKYTA
jgi:hypothetical protein